MSSIVYLRNKDSGKVYVYSNSRETDPSTGVMRNVRKCIGHVDPETGEIVPNRSRTKGPGLRYVELGPRTLIRRMSDGSGLTGILQICFSDRWEQILRAAEHIIRGRDPLSMLPSDPFGMDPQDPSPPAVSLVSMLDRDGIDSFYRIWRKRFDCSDIRYLILESLQSYDPREWFRQGGDDTVQSMCMGLCIDAETGAPVFLERLPLRPERDSDLEVITDRLGWMGCRRILFSSDNCLTDSDALTGMTASDRDFVVRIPQSDPMHADAVAEARASPSGSEGLDRGRGNRHIHTAVRFIGGKKVHLHVYHSAENAEMEMGSFLELIDICREELLNDRWEHSHRWMYERYFIISEEDGQPKVEPNSDAIMRHSEMAGFLVLASRGIRDPEEALSVHMMHRWAEERFDDLKNRTDQLDLKLYLSHRLEARLFLQFVAMTIMHRLHSELASCGLSKDADAEGTMRSLESAGAVVRPSGSSSYTDPGKIASAAIEALGLDIRSEYARLRGRRIP